MGLGESSGRLTLCQHLQNYVDIMALMKVSHTVYVMYITVMLKI